MGYRSDMYAPSGLVDTMIGSSYPVVREVATNIEFVKHVSAHLEQIVEVADSIPEIFDVADLDARLDVIELALPKKLEWATPPGTATSTGIAGQIAYASGFLYICTATNTWKRVAIAAW